MSNKTPSIHGIHRVLLGGGPDAAHVEAFLTFKEHNQGKAKRTVQIYSDALSRLAVFMSGRPILAATDDELTAFCGPWLHKQGVQAVARRPFIAAVREFFKWAVHTRRIRSNPARGLSYPKIGRRLPTMISLANAEKLMYAPDFLTFEGVRDAAILGVLIGCGLRISGLTRLNQGDLAQVEDSGELRMVIKAREKGEKERLVPVPREVEMMLRIYLEHEQMKPFDRILDGGDQVLFVSTMNRMIPLHEYRGERRRIAPRSVRDMLVRYGKAAGVPRHQLHPHAMRHLFGTELAESSVDLLVRQELLGHEDAKHTKIYDHMAMRRKIKEVDRAGPIAKMKTPVSDFIQRLGSAGRPPATSTTARRDRE